jgi:two-component system response regulator WspF
MRIAIVNDLALARAVLRRLVESVPGYEVAWVAADGAEAVRWAAADRPDAVLMDLMMPVLDGAGATRRIMAANPCPILIVTASPGANFGKVYEALGAGGLDAVRTPELGPDGRVRNGEALLHRLAKIERTGRDCHPSGRPAFAPPLAPRRDGPPLVAIGASTGGPEAVARVLLDLGPTPAVPVVVVQHIAADFAEGFATWLADRTGRPARAAVEGGEVEPGWVHVAASDDHLTVRPGRRFGYTATPRECSYRPSVDVFFDSLAERWPQPGAAVLLTGMGHDGARGLARLKAGGWHTVAQDEATCVVYGMPRAAVELGAASEVLPLPRIGRAVRERLTAWTG